MDFSADMNIKQDFGQRYTYGGQWEAKLDRILHRDPEEVYRFFPSATEIAFWCTRYDVRPKYERRIGELYEQGRKAVAEKTQRVVYSGEFHKVVTVIKSPNEMVARLIRKPVNGNGSTQLEALHLHHDVGPVGRFFGRESVEEGLPRLQKRAQELDARMHGMLHFLDDAEAAGEGMAAASEGRLLAPSVYSEADKTVEDDA